MGKGWKTGEETDNQQCCLLRCIFIVFYLLCLIYGTLYNECVLQSLWVLEPPPPSPPLPSRCFIPSHLGRAVLHPAVHDPLRWSPLIPPSS